MRTGGRRRRNFKWPKNREDSSDLDENLTETIAAMKTIISKIFWGRFGGKTARKHRETVVAGVGGCVAAAAAAAPNETCLSKEREARKKF